MVYDGETYGLGRDRITLYDSCVLHLSLEQLAKVCVCVCGCVGVGVCVCVVCVCGRVGVFICYFLRCTRDWKP